MLQSSIHCPDIGVPSVHFHVNDTDIMYSTTSHPAAEKSIKEGQEHTTKAELRVEPLPLASPMGPKREA